MGAAAGAVAWGVGGGMTYATGGEHLIASAAVAGAAAGATRAALGGGNVWQAALISGSVGAASAYLQAQGASPGQAEAKAQSNQQDKALDVDGGVTLVGAKEAWVLERSISISSNKTLSFDVRTTGFSEGESISAMLETGSALDQAGGGISDPRFSRFADVFSNVHGGTAHFSYPLTNFGDTYLRIQLPFLQSSTAAPPIMTFGAQGGISPCGAGKCDTLHGYGGAGRY